MEEKNGRKNRIKPVVTVIWKAEFKIANKWTVVYITFEINALLQNS